MARAKLIGQDRPGSFHVSLGWGRGGRKVAQREEAYLVYRAQWNGDEILVNVTADRYLTSSGTLTDWRPIVAHTAPVVSDIARRALSELLSPLVMEWLDSEEYRRARQLGYAQALAREISEERYNTDRPAQAIEAFRHEVAPEDHGRLIGAVESLRALLNTLAEVGK